MCTYHGILEEYPLISIDSFESHNYTSTIFFITHVHMDHLIGLERPEFGKYVAKINAPIYLSEISKEFLSTMNLYQHLVPYFKTVPLNQPFILTIQSKDPVQAKKREGGDNESLKTTLCSHAPDVDETIVVTCFGSGHCPGSMMIWIEGEHGNVLFTGDFRLYHGQAKHLNHLYRRRTDTDDDYLFKPIDNMYIDMTFFRPEILHIPTREVSCDALILWIKDMLKKNPNVNFYFKTSARVGYEQIYRALYEKLGMRVHVEKGQYEFFACLPNIQEWLTTDPTMTCFHACRTASSNFSQACASFRYCEKPIRILLSIMWFTEQVSASELLVKYHEYHSNFDQKLSKTSFGFDESHQNLSTSDQFLNYRLCYSLHSSFSEVADVLQTLRPKRVTPIAAPLATQMTTKRLFRLIDFFIQDPSSTSTVSVSLDKLAETIVKKTISTQIQLKHRYESFETKIERRRRKKIRFEQQKRKLNGEELDLGIDDEREENILRCIHRLHNTKRFSSIGDEFPLSIGSMSTRKFRLNEEQQIKIVDQETKITEKSLTFAIDNARKILSLQSESELVSVNQSDESLLENQSVERVEPIEKRSNRRISSDSSCDTIDYELDYPISISLTMEFQPSPLSIDF